MRPNLPFKNHFNQNKVVVTSVVDQFGYLTSFSYYGKDDDIQLLIDKINEFGSRQSLSLFIMTKISFTGKKFEKLLKVLQNRTLNMFWIHNYLGRQETRVVLDFLTSPNAHYLKYNL